MRNVNKKQQFFPLKVHYFFTILHYSSSVHSIKIKKAHRSEPFIKIEI